jgi:hypothetical protein
MKCVFGYAFALRRRRPAPGIRKASPVTMIIKLDGSGTAADVDAVADMAPKRPSRSARCRRSSISNVARVAPRYNPNRPRQRQHSGRPGPRLRKGATAGAWTLAIVGDVGQHENLASCRRTLEQEPGYDRVADFVRNGLRPRRAGDGLGEFAFGHSQPPLRLDFSCRIGAARNPTVAYGWLGEDHEATLKSYELQVVIVAW